MRPLATGNTAMLSGSLGSRGYASLLLLMAPRHPDYSESRLFVVIVIQVIVPLIGSMSVVESVFNIMRHLGLTPITFLSVLIIFDRSHLAHLVLYSGDIVYDHSLLICLAQGLQFAPPRIGNLR